LKGTGEKPSLLLLLHLDVVAANVEEWSLNPFGGVDERISVENLVFGASVLYEATKRFMS
jgi:acetylornithine deacetylase/succinyl-diaminopimelate desuccinylase-like protein